MTTEREGHREGAQMLFAMHKAAKKTKEGEKRKQGESPPQLSEEEEAWPEDLASESEPGNTSDQESVVAGITFTSGAIPKHDDMGSTPYFDKNCWELRGPIPLKIFNKKWKNAAIIHHTEKQSCLEDLSTNRNRYTGYPYPSKWTQNFSNWTINHCGFYLTMGNV